MFNHEITIRVTVAEFVVLDAMLRRYSETDQLEIEDQAEQRALWNLQCVLEREGSRDDSWPSVEQARAALRDSLD